MCFFLIIPLFFSASTLNSDLPAADQIPQKNSSIYISAGATVIGTEHIYISDAGHEKVKTSKIEVEKPAISSEKLSKEKNKEKEVLAKKYPPAKPVYNFENTESKSRLAFGAGRYNVTALNFNTKKLKFSSTSFYPVHLPVTFNYALKTQKFYTSISYLLFGKYRSSSLRAPPAFS